ncbi:ephrin type-B receptor 1-B-like [Rhopilema esculentum]|uniref:ephrin type-B receptor 1-B-like n=1 Tax=Rhopilema esculentum TaxID=499914 RepID=UPI0031E36FCE
MAAFKVLLLGVLMHVASPDKVKIGSVQIEQGKSYPNTNKGKDNWVYGKGGEQPVACATDNKTVDSYLVFPYVMTEPANEIVVEVKYALKTCPFLDTNCKYSLGLYALKTDYREDILPSPMENKYLFAGRLQNKSALSSDFKDFASNISIGMDGKKGVFLALRDTGICGNVKSLNVWYFACPSEAGLLLEFNGSPAPNRTTSVLHVKGMCVPNAVPVTRLEDNLMHCFPNGTARVYGGCQCDSGFVMTKSKSCKDCEERTFKAKKGNGPCLRCGRNVKDGLLPRRTVCQCLEGYFRPEAHVEDYFVDCEEPPSAPRKLNASLVKSQWALISWDPPSKKGTGNDIQFDVQCKGCETKNFLTRDLEYNLTSLKTYSFYEVTIFSINNVTKATGKSNSMTYRFQTLTGLPSAVQNLESRRNDDGSVTVIWEPPSEKGGPDLKYHIIVNGNQGEFQMHSNLTINRKKKLENYKVSVRSYTSAGFSEKTTINFKIQGTEKGIAVEVVVAICVSLGFLIIVAILVIVYTCRRRVQKNQQPVRLQSGEVILPKFGRRHVYVDPTVYQDVADAVRDFTKELQRDWVILDSLIGGGEFGDVYKGTLQRPLEEEITVAIKTLRDNVNKKAKEDFLAEAAYMGQFDDPNVVALEGVITKEQPVMILIEYMTYGSLDSFLQDNDGGFTSLQLLGMARGVSSGMTYLSEMSFIHRDLAARNILVNEDMVCKVADFGMSRELSEDDAYNTTGGKIPVRWTAPEAIQFKKFTTASDVWSYGILLWEIMSYGERPYWDWGNYEVIERLGSGYRLPPPMGCPKVVHDLMLSCWEKDRGKRRRFRELRSIIDNWLESPELLTQEASVVTKRDEDLDYASMTTLKEWLDSINMGQYVENFTKKGFVTPRQILEFTDAKLMEIGIFAIGHRRKITKSIRVTKRQLGDEF